MPKNLVSGNAYRGINVFLLGCQTFASPWWLTFRQVRALGGRVRRGERSTPVVFWKWIERNTEDEATGETTTKELPLLRYYRVFNFEQCEGLPEKAQTGATAAFNPIREAERIIEKMPAKPGVRHNRGVASYNPATYLVSMPRKTLFRNPEEYYSTFFHELTHSTGHPSRLNRLKKANPAPFGSDSYSREELVAEMGAAFLCSYSGIVNRTIENSAAYIQGWMRRLQDDKRLVILAASEAQRAADFILGRSAETLTTPPVSATPSLPKPPGRTGNRSIMAGLGAEYKACPAALHLLAGGAPRGGRVRPQQRVAGRLAMERHPDALSRVLWGYKSMRPR